MDAGRKEDLILNCVALGMELKQAYYAVELTQEEMARIFALGSAEGRIVDPKELAPAWD